MDFPTVKDLKKLAAACRKSGISNFKYFKDGGFEISLEADFEEKKVSLKADKQTIAKDATVQTPGLFESDTLTEDQLLMWSAGEPAEDVSQGPKQ